ncbi:hypothetical protein A6V36_24300 [Paraburkholderia ginsengiterrae]|uniref:Zinc-finger domain-containing protein n=1 Tax=Paraburkholderia ginsengiterrae TaxID=1462993 RepID=A0A1A9NBB0_9BURK|nr:hypothetical protein [Paraburkholderia ginsengiterrae]OAJ61497.1 hypothetical protein A6V36_24300 [Paraburkholderia ginsengiterrae]OAJ62899.1 hypothetical protein A6V37_22075 [Paraburkholderia ginsengiterrae]
MSDLHRQDRIDELVQKLSAMLTVTCGECGEPFRRMSDNIQDNYMWACADMARKLQDLILGTSKANRTTAENDHA